MVGGGGGVTRHWTYPDLYHHILTLKGWPEKDGMGNDQIGALRPLNREPPTYSGGY